MTWGSNDSEPRGEPWPLEVSLKVLETVERHRAVRDLDELIGTSVAVAVLLCVYLWLFLR